MQSVPSTPTTVVMPASRKLLSWLWGVQLAGPECKNTSIMLRAVSVVPLPRHQGYARYGPLVRLHAGGFPVGGMSLFDQGRQQGIKLKVVAPHVHRLHPVQSGANGITNFSLVPPSIASHSGQRAEQANPLQETHARSRTGLEGNQRLA